MEKQWTFGIRCTPRFLVHFRVGVAIDKQQILPAVVVEVKESIAKTDEGDGYARDTDLVADVVKISRSIIFEDYFVIVRERSGHEIHVPVVLIITGGNPHVRHFAAVSIQGEATGIALIFKRTVPFIDV